MSTPRAPKSAASLAAAAAAVLVAAPGAGAQVLDRSMMLELHVGPYDPAIDEQFVTATPYDDVFGDEGVVLFGFHLDRQLFQSFGSLGLGGGLRYGWVDGKALADDGTKSKDETTLHLLPVQLSLVYRLDVAAVRWDVPFVPYAKGGLTYALWWVTNGRDEIANAYDQDGNGRVGAGGTLGWHFAAGLQLLLDWLDGSAAQELDNESGVNNSYLFAEWSLNSVNDFGSATSMELSDRGALSFGLMFEF